MNISIWSHTLRVMLIALLCMAATGPTLAYAQAINPEPRLSYERTLAAEKFFRKSIDYSPDNNSSPEASSIQANLLWCTVQLDSLHAMGAFNLAYTYYTLGRAEETLKSLQTAYRSSGHDPTIGGHLLDMALSLEKKGVMEEVLSDMKREYPDDPEVRNQASDYYTRAGLYGKALAELDTLILTEKDNPMIIFNRAALTAQLGKADKAVQQLLDRGEETFRNLQLGMLLAKIYHNTGQGSKAKSTIERLKRHHPEALPLLDLSAQICTQLGDYGCAVQTLAKISRIEGISPIEIKQTISTCYEAADDKGVFLKLLIPVLEQIVEDYPLSQHFAIDLAQAHLVQSDTLKAERIYSSLIDQQSIEEAPYLYFVQKHAQGENATEMKRLTQRARQVFPTKGVYYLYEVIASLGDNTPEESVQQLIDTAIQQVSKSDTYYGALLLFKADILLEAGQYKQSLPYYEEATRYTNNATVYNNYAYALVIHGTPDDLDKAESLASKAVNLQSDNASFLDTYAWVLYLKGQYALAKIYIENAIRYSTEEGEVSAVLYGHYADILSSLGDKEAALKAWQQFIQAGGNAEEARQKIESLTP